MAPYEDWNKVDEDEDDELQDTSVRLLQFFGVSAKTLNAPSDFWGPTRHSPICHWLLWVNASRPWRSKERRHKDFPSAYCPWNRHGISEAESSRRAEWYCWNIALQHREPLSPFPFSCLVNEHMKVPKKWEYGTWSHGVQKRNLRLPTGGTDWCPKDTESCPTSSWWVNLPPSKRFLSSYILLSFARMHPEARHNHEWLRYEFPPGKKQVPLGDVFTSCNWALRDGWEYIYSKITLSSLNNNLIQSSQIWHQTCILYYWWRRPSPWREECSTCYVGSNDPSGMSGAWSYLHDASMVFTGLDSSGCTSRTILHKYGREAIWPYKVLFGAISSSTILIQNSYLMHCKGYSKPFPWGRLWTEWWPALWRHIRFSHRWPSCANALPRNAKTLTLQYRIWAGRRFCDRC